MQTHKKVNRLLLKIILQIIIICNIIGNLWSIDTDSYDYIDRLLSLDKPGSPEIYEDAVIFSAPGSYKKVGISFAHENFAKIYWFKKLLVPIPDLEPYNPKSKQPVETHKESGVLFFTYPIPGNIAGLEYRLIINGLWTADPQNPVQRYDKSSGLTRSILTLPPGTKIPASFNNNAGKVDFYFEAERGQTITVAGDFNAWDPFMYELKETAPGKYNLSLPLPSGTYHYIFFHKGQRIRDPNNNNMIYYANGNVANEIIVK